MTAVDVQAEWEARIKLLKLMNDEVIEETIEQFQGLINELQNELKGRQLKKEFKAAKKVVEAEKKT